MENWLNLWKYTKQQNKKDKWDKGLSGRIRPGGRRLGTPVPPRVVQFTADCDLLVRIPSWRGEVKKLHVRGGLLVFWYTH